jgi:hypothetical protein
MRKISVFGNRIFLVYAVFSNPLSLAIHHYFLCNIWLCADFICICIGRYP